MLVGTFLQYAAIRQLWSMEGKYLAWYAVVIGAIGFGVFGVGIEIAGITVSKIIVMV